MNSKSFKLSGQGGFSLVELLVVIAVIAIIAAIAIPNIAGITGAANTAKAQRNAQNLASTYNAAVAAGYTNNNPSGVTDAIAAVTAGVEVRIGNTTNYFKVDGLTAPEVTMSTNYLTLSTNATGPKTLIYTNSTP